MTDSDLSRWALYLMGSVVLTLAVHARSVGINQAATGLGVAGFALLLLAYGGELSFIHRHAAGRGGVWLAVAAVTAIAGLAVRRERSIRADRRGASRLPIIALSSWCTAAFSLFGACSLVVDAANAFLYGLALWCLVVWAALGISAALIAQNMSVRRESGAWVGSVYALWSSSVLVLPFLGLLAGSVAVAELVIFAALFLPISGPFVSAYLVGDGPIPRDLGYHAPETGDSAASGSE